MNEPTLSADDVAKVVKDGIENPRSPTHAWALRVLAEAQKNVAAHKAKSKSRETDKGR